MNLDDPVTFRIDNKTQGGLTGEGKVIATDARDPAKPRIQVASNLGVALWMDEASATLKA